MRVRVVVGTHRTGRESARPFSPVGTTCRVSTLSERRHAAVTSRVMASTQTVALSASGSRQRLSQATTQSSTPSAAHMIVLLTSPTTTPDDDDGEKDAPKAELSYGAPTRAQQLLHLATRKSSAVSHAAATHLAESEYCALLAQLDALHNRAVIEPETSSKARALRKGALSERRRTARIEDALMLLTRLLHNAGCPAWRLQGHVHAASRGLGVHVHVHVFPHHCTLTFSRRLTADTLGAKTLTVTTSPSLDVNALAKVDAIARRLSSWATSDVAGAAVVARNGDGDEDAILDAGSRNAAAWAACSTEQLADNALNAASSGPGFWRDAEYDEDEASSSSDSGSDGEDSDAGEDDVERGSPGLADDSRHLLRMSSSSSQLRRPSRLNNEPRGDDDDARLESGKDVSRAGGEHRRAMFIAAALDETLPQLRALHTAPPLYGPITQSCASAVSAAGCALVFWNASWYDAGLALACGGIVGILGLIFNGAWGNRAGVRRIAGYELCAAACVSLLTRFADAAAAAGKAPPVCASAVRLGALQWLLQGWDITAAFIELTNRNAALCGAAHLLVAVTVTSLIGVGIELGDTVADAIHLPAAHTAAAANATDNSVSPSCSHGVSLRWYFPVFLLTSVSLGVQCNAARQQLPAMVTIAMATFAISVGAPLVHNATLTSLSTLLAALAAGFLANTYANKTGKPAVGGAAIGVFVLVPDGMSELNSITAVLTQQGKATGSHLMASLTLTASIVQTCVTIGGGVFIASLLVSPKELMHTHEGTPEGGRLHRMLAACCGRGRLGGKRMRKYGRSRALPLFF